MPEEAYRITFNLIKPLQRFVTEQLFQDTKVSEFLENETSFKITCSDKAVIDRWEDTLCLRAF